MHTWFDLLLAVFVVAGVIGTFIPVVPGTGIIFLGALLHGLATDFSPLNKTVLVVLGVLFFLAQAGQYLITGLGSKRFGSTKYGALGAGGGMLIGFFLPIPGGIFIGAFAGAFLFELVFALQDIRQAARSGAGALAGAIFALFFEFLLALGMAGLILQRLLTS